MPPTLVELLQVPDVGPKKAALFWKQAGVTNLAELESAAQAGKLRALPGMGEKSEKRILEGMEALKRRSTRRLLGNVRPVALRWLEWLRAQPGVTQADAAGSLRRWRATIGDLDLVAACSTSGTVMKAFTAHPDVHAGPGAGREQIQRRAQGWAEHAALDPAARAVRHPAAVRHRLQGPQRAPARNGPEKRALACRSRAARRATGMKSYTQPNRRCTPPGLPWIPPELREDRGEIQAALSGNLPRLVETGQIQSDLHSHTTWSDGSASMQEMAEAAIARGLKVLAITDHSGGLGVASGLSVERLHQQREEIEAVQARLGDRILLLQGSEVEIHADGTLDFPDEVLAELDIVVAALHSSLRQPRSRSPSGWCAPSAPRTLTSSAIPAGGCCPTAKAPTWIGTRCFTAAKEAGVALEIDAHPSRLDLDEVNAQRAVKEGIPLSIDTDAHAPDQLDLMEYGVSVARRAWIGPESVINTWPTERLLAWLKRKSNR